jgi:phosphoribosylglycinamide formyltransferase-1
LAVLISGRGTTLDNLIRRRREGLLNAEIVLVVASTAAAGGLEFARRAGIPQRIIEWQKGRTTADLSQTLFDACRQAGCDLVVMGGFLKKLVIPDDFANRVINIHPALIPAFCGKGMYGRHVHEAVLKYGAKVSGCTVHFVDNEYDHGPIILQQVVPVEPDDTPDTLAARVFHQECQAYPRAINWLAAGRVQVEGRLVHIAPGGPA